MSLTRRSAVLPSRPLGKPATVAGADIPTLLDNLKLPEYRTRYRTRRELRGRDAGEVLEQLGPWLDGLDRSDPRYEPPMLDGLWVSWGPNRVVPPLIRNPMPAHAPMVRPPPGWIP